MTTPIPRSAWGARYPDGFRDRPLPISEWWLHHSVTIAPDLVPPFDDDDAAVRTLERIGQQRFGGGISYTYPVTPVGRIYVGHSLHRQGAHTRGHNTVGAAFVLVGDYSKRAPSAAQEHAIAARMVADYRAGKARTYQLAGGHRDASGSSTACPGDAAHARIGAINALARQLLAGATSSPAPKPGPRLAVDGKLGPATIRRWQQIMRTTPDGVISRPSELVRAVQRRLHVTVDGVGIASNNAGDYGPTLTVRALQRYLGTTPDGVLSHPRSEAVAALQRRLNTGRF